MQNYSLKQLASIHVNNNMQHACVHVFSLGKHTMCHARYTTHLSTLASSIMIVPNLPYYIFQCFVWLTNKRSDDQHMVTPKNEIFFSMDMKFIACVLTGPNIIMVLPTCLGCLGLQCNTIKLRFIYKSCKL